MKLKVLVACEESQAVCKEFRRLGHEAYSCDLQNESGGHPEWHIVRDVLEIADGRCRFMTSDGAVHEVSKWDLIIAHPPCTYLAKSGQRWCNVPKYGDKALERMRETSKAIDFFSRFVLLKCEHVAIENPVGPMSKAYREPDQTIHPWMFGSPVRKATCLWLKNLPPLVPDTLEQPEIDVVKWTDRFGNVKRQDRFFYETRFLPAEERRRKRSKTFPGIAKAMAEQWSAYLASAREPVAV